MTIINPAVAIASLAAKDKRAGTKGMAGTGKTSRTSNAADDLADHISDGASGRALAIQPLTEGNDRIEVAARDGTERGDQADQRAARCQRMQQ